MMAEASSSGTVSKTPSEWKQEVIAEMEEVLKLRDQLSTINLGLRQALRDGDMDVVVSFFKDATSFKCRVLPRIARLKRLKAQLITGDESGLAEGDFSRRRGCNCGRSRGGSDGHIINSEEWL